MLSSDSKRNGGKSNLESIYGNGRWIVLVSAHEWRFERVVSIYHVDTSWKMHPAKCGETDDLVWELQLCHSPCHSDECGQWKGQASIDKGAACCMYRRKRNEEDLQRFSWSICVVVLAFASLQLKRGFPELRLLPMIENRCLLLVLCADGSSGIHTLDKIGLVTLGTSAAAHNVRH